MPFCMNCGSRLIPNARFCARCGAPVPGAVAQIRGTEQLGKCPNCGATISRLDATCRYCGAQVINKEASYTVKQFAEELAKIEEEAYESEPKGILGAYAKSMTQVYGDKTFNRKISHISTFPIPNTVEEISEFVMLAIANINVEFGKKTLQNARMGRPGFTSYREVTLANTWISKLEQAYNKALISFPDDPMFQKIKGIYENKMRELKRL